MPQDQPQRPRRRPVLVPAAALAGGLLVVALAGGPVARSLGVDRGSPRYDHDTSPATSTTTPVRRFPAPARLSGEGQVVASTGEVVEVSADSITVRDAQGVATTFALEPATRFRQHDTPITRAAVRRGATVLVSGNLHTTVISAVLVSLDPDWE